MDYLNIPKENLFANRMIFDSKGLYYCCVSVLYVRNWACNNQSCVKITNLSFIITY